MTFHKPKPRKIQKTFWTPEREAKLVRLFHEKKKDPEIQKEFNREVSIDVIAKRRQKLGLRYTKQGAVDDREIKPKTFSERGATIVPMPESFDVADVIEDYFGDRLNKCPGDKVYFLDNKMVTEGKAVIVMQKELISKELPPKRIKIT